MLSNIFEIHIKVKPRHQKDPKLLKLKHSDRANSWKIWFWSFPQCFLAYLWKYICLFLDFQKWTKWRSAAKKLCRNNRKRKWKEKFKLVRVQWKWNNNKSYKMLSRVGQSFVKKRLQQAPMLQFQRRWVRPNWLRYWI